MGAVERSALLFALHTGLPIPVETRTQAELKTTGTQASPSNPNSACSGFRSSLPDGFQQGFITVPEDWQHPDGRKIRVFYYARLQKDEQGGVIRPVVFFNGGPGGDSHSSYNILERQSASQDISFIYVDQRGTGCSDAFPVVPVTLDTAKRLELYGSRSIVRDAEALRIQLLGAQTRWTAFGQSYGGEIVHRYIEVAPQGLNGAYAHGASIMADPVAWLVQRLESQRRVIGDYFASYPEDAERLSAIRALIADTRCFQDGTTRICGPAVLDAATALLGFRTQWGTLHAWLAKLRNSDGSLAENVLANFVRGFAFGVYASNGFASSVISYSELTPGYTDAAGCHAALARLQGSSEDSLSWPINECRILMALRFPWDGLIDGLKTTDALSLEGVAKSLEQMPSLPFFLYSGEKDVFVPVGTFHEEVSLLGSRITYRDFPNSGHDGFYSEQQVWDDLMQGTSQPMDLHLAAASL